MNVSTVSAHGFVTFATITTPPKITAKIISGDDITKAKTGETWEFDTQNGFVIFKKWGVSI
jgi:hypothetical protein